QGLEVVQQTPELVERRVHPTLHRELHAGSAARRTARTFSGVIGSEVIGVPMASNTAQAIAAAGGVIPLSPMPLWPYGWAGSSDSIWINLSISGTDPQVGT